MYTFRTGCTLAALIFLWLGTSPPLWSQHLSRSVVAATGAYAEQPGIGSLHWTVGEVDVIQYQNGSELGAGFHRAQYRILVHSTDELRPEWQVRVFPNPTAERLRVNLSNTGQGHIRLLNAQGQLLWQSRWQGTQLNIDLQQYPAGTYWLQLYDLHGQQYTSQVQKINY